MNCGGFRYDDTTLQLTDGVLSAIGGAGGGITQAQADARYLLKDNGDATGTTTMFSLVVQEEVSSASVISDSGTFKDATVSNVLTIPATGMVECHGNFAAYGPAYFVAGVDCSGLQITNVGDPKSNLDAANKKYVDDAVSGAASPVGYLKADGTVPMTGNLSMGLHKITGLAEPIDEGDAVTKKYVDDILYDENVYTATNFLNLAGTSTMKADLKMGAHKIVNVANPTLETDAATKYYVDDQINGALINVSANYLDVSGSTAMVGDLKMGTHKVTGLAAPTLDTDGATKKYVDDKVSSIPAPPSLDGYLKADGTKAMTGNLDMGNYAIMGVSNITNTASPGSIIEIGDDLEMSGKKISNLGAPTAIADAATKKYVDDAIAGVPTNYLKTDGTSIMAGQLDMDLHPIVQVSSISGDPAVGVVIESELDLNNHKITGLLTPTADTDASTKKYVDDGLATKQDELTGTNGQVVMIDSTGKATPQDYTPPIPSFPHITVTIPTNEWIKDGDAYKYTWYNNQILGETVQLVIVTTASSSMGDWETNKIRCTGHAVGNLTLSAATVPATSIMAIAVLIPTRRS
jgi:hypothetical protein